MNLTILRAHDEEHGLSGNGIRDNSTFSLFLFIMLILFGCSGTDTSNTDLHEIVKTSSGHVKGVEQNGLRIFKGIPYAVAPVGNLRWKAPQPLANWDDTLACTAFGPSPMQVDPKPFRMWTQEFMAPPSPLSEDCLNLNIWTPASTKDAKLPVLVWIYGGGFVSGSGACPVYDGEEISKQGIVYVTINYRVGVFGFMAHPELTSETDYKSSGNYGLLDQIAALKWVQANIASFGGDASKVTIAGQSAGAMSVQSLVASPLAKGLFHGVIAQSGALTSRQPRSLTQAEQDGNTLSSAIKSNLEGLRALTADSVLRLAGTLPYGTYAPIVDGYVIPEDPKKIFNAHNYMDVPTVMGWVTGDADLSLNGVESPDDLKKILDSQFGDRSNEIDKLFPLSTTEEFRQSRQKLGNLFFAAHADVQWAKSNKSPSFVYQFNYVPADKPGFPNYGAFHSADVPFALHTLNQWDRPWTSVDREVEEYMSIYWVNFVKTGSPGIADSVEWTPYKTEQGNIMSLGAKPELKNGLLQAELMLMESRERK